MHHAMMAAELAPIDVDDVARRSGLRRQPFDDVAVTAGRHEADVLAIGLVGYVEAQPAGVLAHFGLAHFAERKTQQPQLLACRGEQDIALVPVGIHGAK